MVLNDGISCSDAVAWTTPSACKNAQQFLKSSSCLGKLLGTPPNYGATLGDQSG